MRRLVLLLIMAAGAHTFGEEAVRFTDTAAARAFQAGQYATAVVEFERLLETNPDNVLVLRYLAMSYDRVGRYSDALRTYVTALSLAPENVALLYHSGETLYNTRYADDARRHFLLVLSLAPGSEYAELARAYLDALTQQRVARQAPGAPRRIGVYAEVGYARDDYEIPGAPDEPDQRSQTDRITEYISAEINLVRRPNLLVSIDFSGYGAQYVRNRDQARDLWQGGAGATLQYSRNLGRTPAVGTLKAYHQEVRFDGGPDYSESDGATAGLQLGLTSSLVTRLYYRYTNDRFENDGFNPAFSSRDGENHAAGVHQTIYFLDGEIWLIVGLAFQDNQAEGRNYDNDGPTLSAQISLPLFSGLRLDVGYEYAEEVYRNFSGPIRRETERHEWNASVHRWFGRNLLVRLRYAETSEDSTIPGLSYDRSGIGMSMAYVY